MTWNEAIIARILLVICRMLSKDDVLTAELRTISNAIGAKRFDP